LAGDRIVVQGGGRRLLIRLSPRTVRERAALTLARRTVRQTYVGSRALVRMRRGRGTLDLRGSLFCNVRTPAAEPLCGFYVALVGRLLELHRVGVRVQTRTCRAVGDRSCVHDLQVGV